MSFITATRSLRREPVAAAESCRTDSGELSAFDALDARYSNLEQDVTIGRDRVTGAKLDLLATLRQIAPARSADDYADRVITIDNIC